MREEDWKRFLINKKSAPVDFLWEKAGEEERRVGIKMDIWFKL